MAPINTLSLSFIIMVESKAKKGKTKQGNAGLQEWSPTKPILMPGPALCHCRPWLDCFDLLR